MPSASSSLKPPYFSVLMPTKNRSEIIGGAISSVLEQGFPDFELIISDNDDSPTATAEAVAKFADTRIRYVRTSGGLAMHDNWENAFNQAIGKHVILLEDKMRFVPNALEILHSHLERLGDVVISYDIQFIKNATMPGPKEVPPAESWKSEKVIQLFTRFEPNFFRLLPKSLDSCAPRELLLGIKKNSPTGYLFSYVTPDYSSGFQVLSTVDSCWFVDKPLVYIPNNWMWQGKYSIGQSSYKKEAATDQWLKELPISLSDIQQFSPVQSKWLWINNVIYDYHTKYQPQRKRPELNWVNYHAFCCILVLFGWKVGGDMRPEVKAIRASLRRQSLGFRARVMLNLCQRVTAMALPTVSRYLRHLTERTA
jgi:glycosyltransferase involved in cell wall biosynthesis